MHISFSTEQLIVWLVIGALAGFITGAVFKGKKNGFGFFSNLIIGLIGAVIGGFIFDFFNIKTGFGTLILSMNDLIAAVAGAFILLIIIAIVKR